MDRLAPELQHMIFAAADRADIPNLRLTCKALAEVGLEHVFSNLQISFNSTSVDRLEQISLHPARHCVKSLIYTVLFAQKWDQALYLEQQSLRKMTNGQPRITTAVSQLVELKHLSFDLDSEPSYGLQYLLSVFLAIDPAKTTLESLTLFCEWRTLDAQDNDYNVIAQAVSRLQAFRIHVATNMQDDIDAESANEACVELFGQGRPLGLLRSMSSLQVLDLSFEGYDGSMPRVSLKQVVGNIHWSALRKVALKGLETTQKDLLQFLKKHAQSLRVAKLDCLDLSQGLWSDVFKEMRKLLNLEECELLDIYNTPGLMDNWDCEKSKELQDYVLGKDVSFEDAIRACKIRAYQDP
ncbi:MAG: hypothetical protein L6R38_005736 [Xanthoria sp. 2 TBL-2021]|nr:MAG: hypothetical protein L6R38_005736 [Xanthoria sp. 2 TBL-2021]